jgi:putative heme transporter
MTSPAAAGEAVPAAVPRGPRRRWGTAAGIAGTAAVAVGAAWAVYGERTTLGQGLHLLTVRTEPGWVIACVGAQCLSMAAFTLVQQCLLRAGGARLTVSWLLSTAYLANAVAVAVPVVGSGMAAGYAYHQFRARRVDPTIAKAALTLAGIISTAAFALIVVAAALVSGNPAAAASAAGTGLAGLVAAAAVLAALRSPAGRARLQHVSSRLLSAVQRILHRPRGDPGQLTQAAVDRLSLFRLTPAAIGVALAWAILNSAADASCLILAIKAVGAPVPWREVLLAWSAGEGAGSFSPTPGGIGVVEVTMTAALAAAGMPAPAALAAVLLYRIVAFKFVLTLAWFGERAVVLHRRRRPRDRTG